MNTYVEDTVLEETEHSDDDCISTDQISIEPNDRAQALQSNEENVETPKS